MVIIIRYICRIHNNNLQLVALRAYRRIGDVGMANVLEDIRYMEDVNQISGFCCMLLEKYKEGKEFFLKGSYTKDALDISRDMLQWEQSLLLAHKYEPGEAPFIAREYAQQLEFK